MSDVQPMLSIEDLERGGAFSRDRFGLDVTVPRGPADQHRGARALTVRDGWRDDDVSLNLSGHVCLPCTATGTTPQAASLRGCGSI